MKLVVLYEELAVYFQVCIHSFAETYNAEVLLLRKRPNQVAPFKFSDHPNIKIEERENFSPEQLRDLIDNFNPDAIFCGGWSYKPYLAICREAKKRIPVVLGFDNWWQGTLKQRVQVALAKPVFRKCFSASFVPGQPQQEFAQKLGFPPAKIRTGAYSCDVNFFNSLYAEFLEEKKRNFPRRFLFVGRYSPEKGIDVLCEAFARFSSEDPRWELWCAGKGELQPRVHEKIRHLGFVQPDAMHEIVRQTGVFILPSNFEPWGVVAHEFAAAGFPLLLSKNVGAAEVFLEEGKNGFSFLPGDVNSVYNMLRKIAACSDAQLLEMGKHSNERSKKITPLTWGKSLYELIGLG